MKRVLEDSGFGLQEVVYVNAHGTSTPLNDRAETVAIKDVPGNDARQLAQELDRHLPEPPAPWRPLRRCWRACDRVAPPTLNYEQPDEDSTSTTCPTRHARSTSTANRCRLERVRLRRPQRRPVPGGPLTVQLGETTDKLSPIERLEALCDRVAR